MRRTLLTMSFVASLFLVLLAQTTKSSSPDTETALVDSVHKWLVAQAALDRKAMEEMIAQIPRYSFRRHGP